MLIIRDAQRDALREQMEEDFVTKVMRHLRENQDAETYQLDDGQLRERVKFGIEKARGYDLTWEKPITLFVQLMFLISPDFDRQEKIHSLLNEIYEEPNEKMDYLIKNTTDDDWSTARRIAPDPEKDSPFND